ncbi:unnamed protein product [Nezara viridula]|uniref:Uncharacterized protein n=1 Tax=Nezara viridula TaxID=85310 RepID=A0A9P0HE28_NEZVI|nr:unnamed protein product [Nezara viridula]
MRSSILVVQPVIGYLPLLKLHPLMGPVHCRLYICAFAVSALASNWDRLGKPFNPLLGETYELERENYRSADGKGPPSNSDSPVHTPKKVLAKLNSLKMGPFKSQNSVVDAEEADEALSGGAEGGDIPKCDSTYSIDIPNSATLWEATPRPSNSSEFYHFSLFAMSLNELEPGMEKKLCPTDCRLRPDIRKLENGDLDGAAAEKTRLEEKQRDARKARKGKKNEWKPREDALTERTAQQCLSKFGSGDTSLENAPTPQRSGPTLVDLSDIKGLIGKAQYLQVRENVETLKIGFGMFKSI